MTIDIIIPSLNGKELLKDNLPLVIKNSESINQIIVIDDGSSDGTDKFIKNNYPNLTYFRNQTNLGFSKSINLAVKESMADFFVLLNNDVKPQKKYLEKSLKYFENEKMFAISFCEQENSWPEISWSGGKLQFKQGSDRNKPHYSPWASGGSAIFRRLIWNRLGGFDEIYSPGYWEDIDIGWRAWKSGYLIVWEPDAKVIHQHESSFKKINQNYLNLIKQRNELIFTHKNINDKKLLNSFNKQLVNYTFRHPRFIKVIFAFMKKYPEIIKKEYPLTDLEVFELVKKTIK
jgi:O-antigen biosynthesis protein